VDVCTEVVGTDLRLVVRDDRIGGAAVDKESGLIGLIDRLEALAAR
jgi:hypothetical protein